MKLSKVTIMALKGSGTEFKERLAKKCNVSTRTLNRWINQNDDNLTKADVLQMIQEETGLDQSEILEEVSANVG